MIKLKPRVAGDTLAFRMTWCPQLPNGEPDFAHPFDLAGFEATLNARPAGSDTSVPPTLVLTSSPHNGLTMVGDDDDGNPTGAVDVFTALGATDVLTPGTWHLELKVQSATERHTPLSAEVQIRAYR